jgi:hypothetical protein
LYNLFKKKTKLLYDPVTLLLGIYPKELKRGYSRDPCTLVFITALFTTANAPQLLNG